MAEFSVAVEELSDSPTEEKGRDGFRATRRFKCAWADRITLRNELLTFPGHIYPHTNIIARCTSCSAKPFAASRDSQVVTLADGIARTITAPEHAEVEASYETDRTTLAMPNPNPSDPLVPEMISETIEPMLESGSLRGNDFWYDEVLSEKVPESGLPAFAKFRVVYTFVRHHLPKLPSQNDADSIRTFLDDYCAEPTCNNAPLTTKLLGIRFAAETLSLTPPVIEIVTDKDGNRRFTINYKFIWQSQGWNKFPRVKKPVGSIDYYTLGYVPMYFIDPADADVKLFKPYKPVDYSRI